MRIRKAASLGRGPIARAFWIIPNVVPTGPGHLCDGAGAGGLSPQRRGESINRRAAQGAASTSAVIIVLGLGLAFLVAFLPPALSGAWCVATMAFIPLVARSCGGTERQTTTSPTASWAVPRTSDQGWSLAEVIVRLESGQGTLSASVW